MQFPGLRGVLPGFGRQDPNDWGLGFDLKRREVAALDGPSNSPRTFGHFGSKPGSATFLWVDPEAGLACAALADWTSANGHGRPGRTLSDAVLADAAG